MSKRLLEYKKLAVNESCKLFASYGTEEEEIMGKPQTIEEMMAYYDREIDDLQAKNEILQAEKEALERRLQEHSIAGKAMGNELLKPGKECDLYPGEIREILVDILKEARKGMPQGTRRADILEDLLSHNAVEGIPDKKAKALKTALKGYKDLDASLRRKLEDLGIDLAEQGRKHYKLKYYGDDRYSATMACTGGDAGRGGRNLAAEIIQKFL
ncbi:MAG: hypothetical protein II178_10720 [Selenomonadaceae bacterium]|nr:hypothetical protein [Selenomonadaceae bacterium]